MTPMRRLALLVVCAALFACDSDRPTRPLESPAKAWPAKASPATSESEPPAKTTTPTVSDAPAKPDAPKAPLVPAARDFVAELTAKPHPSLVGPFESLTLDPMLTIRTARTQAPHLFEATRPGSFTGPFTYSSPQWPGFEFDVVRAGQIDSELDAWLVDSLRVVMASEGIAARLVAAWGEPQIDRDKRTWLAPDLGLRADLDADRELGADKIVLTLRGYTPLATFIGTDPTLFGFEGGKPILGAKGSDLVRRFGRRMRNYNTIRLWPTERSGTIDLLFADPLALDEDEMLDYVVTGFALDIYDDAAVSALLEAKFGKPKVDRENDRVRVYRKSPRVTFDGAELVVGVAPGY